ncbi:hypothetical protein Avbf_11277 [Armadillidium vulgare]|nr:hypothetical protein Avbf_11277 [Armadillidium vulgare]
MPDSSGISPFLLVTELDYRIAPPLHHTSFTPYIPRDLFTCSHVYLRVDRIRKPLEAPYQGPFKVLSRSSKCFTLLLPSGKHEVVSIDRLKPAILPSADPSPSLPPPPSASSPLASQQLLPSSSTPTPSSLQSLPAPSTSHPTPSPLPSAPSSTFHPPPSSPTATSTSSSAPTCSPMSLRSGKKNSSFTAGVQWCIPFACNRQWIFLSHASSSNSRFMAAIWKLLSSNREDLLLENLRPQNLDEERIEEEYEEGASEETEYRSQEVTEPCVSSMSTSYLQRRQRRSLDLSKRELGTFAGAKGYGKGNQNHTQTFLLASYIIKMPDDMNAQLDDPKTPLLEENPPANPPNDHLLNPPLTVGSVQNPPLTVGSVQNPPLTVGSVQNPPLTVGSAQNPPLTTGVHDTNNDSYALNVLLQQNADLIKSMSTLVQSLSLERKPRVIPPGKYKLGSGETLIQFFARFENYCDAMYPGSIEGRVSLLGTFLEGLALEVYKIITCTSLEYEEVKPVNVSSGETIPLFALRLAGLASRAFPENDVTKMPIVRQKFLKSLPQEVKSKVDNTLMAIETSLGVQIQWERLVAIVESSFPKDVPSNEDFAKARVEDITKLIPGSVQMGEVIPRVCCCQQSADRIGECYARVRSSVPTITEQTTPLSSQRERPPQQVGIEKELVHDQVVLVDAVPGLPRKVTIDPAMIHFHQNRAVMMIRNEDERPKKLKKGCKIGEIELLENLDPSIGLVEINDIEKGENQGWTPDRLMKDFKEPDLDWKQRKRIPIEVLKKILKTTIQYCGEDP